MKQLLLFAAAVIVSGCSCRVSAQRRELRPLQYVAVDLNAGTCWGPQLGISYVRSDRHEWSAGLAGFFVDARNVPEDYRCERCHKGIGNDWIAGGAFGYGYVLHTSRKSDAFRVILRGGLLLGGQRLAADFDYLPNARPGEANYTFSWKYRFGAALLVRPVADLVVERGLRVSAGPFAILSRDFSYAGVSVGLRVGRVSGRIYQPRNPALRR